MRQWRIFNAPGSTLVLQNTLNDVQKRGFTVFSVVGPEHFIEEQQGTRWENSLWVVIAYKDEP